METDRGSLPFALVHGESLVATTAWALGEAGVFVVDLGTGWDAVVDAGTPFVLHDALCPMTPPAFLAACVAHADASSVVTVGVRPVTDTVKQLRDGLVGDTVDRNALVQVVSPIVLPAAVVAALDGVPAGDFAGWWPRWRSGSRSRRSRRPPRRAGSPTRPTCGCSRR